MIEIENKKKLTALLVGVVLPGEELDDKEHSLFELESLVKSIDLEPLHCELCSLRKREPRFLLTKGKAEDIFSLMETTGADILVFDCALSPSQQRNWEKAVDETVIDREEVILDIFASRAQTKEACLQVELAKREYDLPRLTRAWSHLSRQRGGNKGTRDAGETQLEMDKRIVLKRISKLKKELEQVRRGRSTMRKQRNDRPVPSISIVGYTNAGKSTLLNKLCGSDVMAENRLFATLDPTSRMMRLPSGTEVIFTDTVGFIRNLPHHLIDAFRSTLEETVLADFLIHVVDAADENYLSNISTTNQVLEELGAGEKNQLIVFNKADEADEETRSLIALEFPSALVISAVDGEGIELLLDQVTSHVSQLYQSHFCHIPFKQYDLISLIRKEGRIINETHLDDGTLVEAALTPRLEGLLKNYLVDNPTS